MSTKETPFARVKPGDKAIYQLEKLGWRFLCQEDGWLIYGPKIQKMWSVTIEGVGTFFSSSTGNLSLDKIDGGTVNLPTTTKILGDTLKKALTSLQTLDLIKAELAVAKEAAKSPYIDPINFDVHAMQKIRDILENVQ